VELADVLVFEDEIAVDHLTCVFLAPPEAGVGELFGEVLVDGAGHVDHGASPL